MRKTAADTSPETKKDRLAIALLILAALMASSGGLLIKSVDLPPLDIVSWRCGFAAIVLSPLLKKTDFTWSRAQLGGALAFATTAVLFVLATKYTTAANAVLLQFTAPIYVAIFSSAILAEPLRRADWLGIPFVLLGITMFFLDDLSYGGFRGNILAALSGLSLAWLFLFLRLQKAASPLVSVFLGCVLATTISWPLSESAQTPNFQTLVLLLLLGGFQLAIPYLLNSKAIKLVSAWRAILIATLEPIFNPLWVLLLIGEKPGYWALVGGALVVTTVTVRGLSRADIRPDKQQRAGGSGRKQITC